MGIKSVEELAAEVVGILAGAEKHTVDAALDVAKALLTHKAICEAGVEWTALLQQPALNPQQSCSTVEAE